MYKLIVTKALLTAFVAKLHLQIHVVLTSELSQSAFAIMRHSILVAHLAEHKDRNSMQYIYVRTRCADEEQNVAIADQETKCGEVILQRGVSLLTGLYESRSHFGQSQMTEPSRTEHS